MDEEVKKRNKYTTKYCQAIMLDEISQSLKDKYHVLPDLW